MKQDAQNPKEHKERSLGLSTAQVTGSALAAMSGAFVASWAGTTGTLIGAAVGSVIATVGAATYTWSIQRTGHAVRRTAAQVRTGTLVSATAITEALPRPGQRRSPGEADDPVEDPTEEVSPTGRRWRLTGDLPWAKVALASLAVMVLGMGGITAVETLTGKPIGSFFGKDDGSGTTVGRVVSSAGSTSSSDEETTPSPTESTDEKSSSTPTSTPSSEPSESPSSAPSTTPTPTADPSESSEPSAPPAVTESAVPDQP
jgi:hypothetical protein